MKHHSIAILISSAVLLGCADSHQLVRYGKSETNLRLAANDTIYVGVSRDGIYGTRTYKSSGLTTSRILLSSFAKRARRVEIGQLYQSYDAIKFARDNGFRYLVYPTILHWEDRATEWSALPDRVEVKVDIIESITAKLLDSLVITGKSGLATFGGDHPQDLLPKPVDEFVSSLFDRRR